MWAVAQKNAKAVEVLLAAGADHSAKSGGAGLPRNYLAQRVNVRAVEEAQRRASARDCRRAAPTSSSSSGSSRTASTWAARAMRSCPIARAAAAPARPVRPQRRAPAARRPRLRRRRPPGCRPGPRWRGRGATPAPAAERQAPDPDDDTEVVVAGLVGSGGGGLTPLVFAAREGDLESARLLVEAGANVNQQTEYGWTPLLTAVNNRNYQVAQLLIEQRRRRQPGQQGRLDAALPRRRQPQHRGRRLSGAEGRPGSPAS